MKKTTNNPVFGGKEGSFAVLSANKGLELQRADNPDTPASTHGSFRRKGILRRLFSVKSKKPPKVKITLSAVLFYASFIIYDPSLYALLPLLAAACHEAGHIIALKLCNIHADQITICPLGVDIRVRGARSYAAELIVAGAGIAANLLLCAVFFPFAENSAAALFILSNLTLAALNILPVKPLDGGVFFAALLCLRYDFDKAERICSAASLLSLILLWLVTSYLLLFYFSAGSLSLMALTICMFAEGHLK